MNDRSFRGLDVRVSEVGFGLWAVSTGWSGGYTGDEAVQLMRRALDREVKSTMPLRNEDAPGCVAAN